MFWPSAAKLGIILETELWSERSADTIQALRPSFWMSSKVLVLDLSLCGSLRSVSWRLVSSGQDEVPG